MFSQHADAPILHVDDPLREEIDKYEEICVIPKYNEVHPGVRDIDWFLKEVRPTAGETLIDIGCGAGGAGLIFQENGLRVHWLDLVDVRVDPKINKKQFIKGSVWDKGWTRTRAMGWDYGYCCDVMEHLPKEFTLLTIDRVLSCCRLAWFKIALFPETHGQLINKRLHLTVEPFTWWRDRIAKLGDIVDARDLAISGLFVVKGR